MKEHTESSYYYINLFLKWKKQFVIITLIALVTSAIFSGEWFIKPKYKSFALIYPANIAPYSTESQTEQLLQLFESSEIRNSVIEKFDLAKHYKIDTSEKASKYRLIKEYESNVKVSRTEYESVEIDVLDTDPVIARDMVNEITNGLNLKARNLQREKTNEVLVIVTNQLKLKKRLVDSMGDLLNELRAKYQLLDYNVQTKEVTKSYLKAIGSGKSGSSKKEIESMLISLIQKGGEFDRTKRTYDLYLDNYNGTKLEYDNVLKDMKKELTYTNMVTKPSIADKKTYPIRWLIVLVSVVSVNLFLLIILLFFDKKSEFKL